MRSVNIYGQVSSKEWRQDAIFWMNKVVFSSPTADCVRQGGEQLVTKTLFLPLPPIHIRCPWWHTAVWAKWIMGRNGKTNRILKKKKIRRTEEGCIGPKDSDMHTSWNCHATLSTASSFLFWRRISKEEVKKKNTLGKISNSSSEE